MSELTLHGRITGLLRPVLFNRALASILVVFGVPLCYETILVEAGIGASL